MILNDSNLSICRKWVLLAVMALAISGLLSVVVVLLRMQGVKSLFFSANDLFDISLVIHVDLSVLVWTFSIICAIFGMFFTEEKQVQQANYCFYLALASTILMIIAIFFPDTFAIKNNYIPMLSNKVFPIGVIGFFCGILGSSVITNKSQYQNYLSVGIYGISVIIFAGFCSFFFAYQTIPEGLKQTDILMFYEHLFWGGGHILQFAFSQALFMVFVLILNESRLRSNDASPDLMQNKYVFFVVVVNTLIAMLAPVLYLIYTCDDPNLISFFSWHMRIGGAIIPIALLVLCVRNFHLLLMKENLALFLSLILFGYGGLLGILSTQGNVTVPAHYHGSIVGMTIAFMGFIYWIMPNLRFAKVPFFLSNAQLYIYGAGQFFHITALEWLGGYGALRKVTEFPETNMLPRVMFAVGGMMAVIGGFMFALIVLKYMLKKVEQN